jgi:ComF family protein
MAGQYIEPVSMASPARLLPAQCSICRAWCRGALCDDCRLRFAAPRARCRRCAIVLPAAQPECGACLREPPPFGRAWTAIDYAHPWNALIVRFKFHGGVELAPLFAGLLREAVRDDTPPDLLLPAPLSEARLRERGFNQSWEIARRLGPRADARLLLRIRETPHQVDLPLDRRAANVRGAFAVEPLRRAEVAGRSVALVDDVLTTGATAAEMARTLLDAGAARVHLWVLARTPPPEQA